MSEISEEMKKRVKTERPLVQIGKNGLSAESIEQVKAMLKKRRIIKVKMLGTFVEGKDKKALARELAERTDSLLVDMTGFMVVLAKKNKGTD